MSDKIIMPRELTAENGAKALLIGEFSETVIMTCEECEGQGHTCNYNEICELCNGAGEYSLNVAVGWDTIKNIYAMAAKHLGIELNNNQKGEL